MELDTHNPYITHATLDRIKFGTYGQAAIQRFMQKNKLLKGVEIKFINGGELHIVKDFYYPDGMLPMEVPPKIHKGQRFYRLEEYLGILLRAARIKQAKVDSVRSVIDRCMKELKELREKKDADY